MRRNTSSRRWWGALAGLLLLGACGNSSGPGGSGAPGTSDPQGSAASEDLSDVRLDGLRHSRERVIRGALRARGR
jgi:hypothetical protein